ncbi:MAG TPA: hypothetical protein VNF24_09520 [Candidatus Acidoferrales bacterium]|nr:hypothetical protein [Candidatus Acidoferrales bacterium]
MAVRLPFGAPFDRLEGRRALVLAEIGNGLLTPLIPIAGLLHGPVLVVIFVVTAPLSLLKGFCAAGVASLTPRIASRDQQIRVYSLVETAAALAWVAGPLLAGIVATAFGAATGLAIDGVSFFILAVGLAVLRAEPLVISSAAASVWQDARAGLHYFIDHANLRRAQLAWTFVHRGWFRGRPRPGLRVHRRAAVAIAA